MKTGFLFIIAILFGININAQTQTQTTTPDNIDNPNAPEIIFETETYDFGLIQKGDPGTCSFTFTNTGKEPLILSNVKASCGCTTPSWPKEPIAPGKSDKIQVKYNTQREGKFSKTITITSNAKTPTKIIKITGEVQATPTIMEPLKEDDPMVPKAK